MPYLEPAAVLRRFSRFALEEIRPAIDGEERFVRGQVGSMASTLRFLAGELDASERAVTTQENALHEALDGVEHTLDDHDAAAMAVREALADARDTLDGTDDEAGSRIRGTRERETTLLEACDDVLARVEANLDDETARAVRRPLYDFLDARLDAQLRTLGRRNESGDGSP